MYVTHTEWGPAAAAMTVQWWWQRAEAYHADQSDWQTSRWRRRPEPRLSLGGSSRSKSWGNNCAGFWWNSTGCLFQWTWRRDERVRTWNSTISHLSLNGNPVYFMDKSGKLFFYNTWNKSSQCEAEDEAVLPDNTSPTQLQNWKVPRPTVFSVCWIYLCKQKKRMKKYLERIQQISKEPNVFRLGVIQEVLNLFFFNTFC